MAGKCEIAVFIVAVIGIAAGSMVKWEIKDAKNKSCVMVDFEGNISLHDASKNKTVQFDLSNANATVDNGSCAGANATSQDMTVDLSSYGKLKMHFTKNGQQVSLTYNYTFQANKVFPSDNSTKTVTLQSAAAFDKVPVKNSYSCIHVQSVNLTGSAFSGSLQTSNATMQAFDITNNTFSPAEHCAADLPTTQKTTPTTTIPKTTTIAPPMMRNFNLTIGNETCIVLFAGIKFVVDYKTTDKKTRTGVFDIPANVTVTGACATNTSASAKMVLNFGDDEKSSLTLSFTDDKKKQESTFNGFSAVLKITNKTFPDAADQTLNTTGKLQASYNDTTYFICNAGTKVSMDTVEVSMGSGWKVQAFNVMKGEFSGKGEHCKADMHSSTASTPVTSASTPVTTTAAPNPVNNYTVKGDNGTICIFMKASMEFNVTYLSNAKKNKTHMIYIPSGASATGNCSVSDTKQLMTISFGAKMNAADDNAGLTLLFVMDKNNKYTISDFMLILNSDILPDAKLNETVSLQAVNTSLFQAAQGGSYLCNTQTNVGLSNADKNSTVFFQANLMIKDLQYKAFSTDNTTTFKDVVECSADNDSNSIVPIAVGAALAGLVVIVLIAYLIGRRRSKRYGYESV